MRLSVNYNEFPKVNGNIIPIGTRYSPVVDVEFIEDESEFKRTLHTDYI
ncbi:hypothetical protein ACIQXQ_20205 [Peribacillus sp. NPDC097198]